MASTVFVDYSPSTPIVAAWLNDVNTTTYTTVPALITQLNLPATTRGMPVVSSIAALRAVPKQANASVFVTSYYGDGKSGGGLYIYIAGDTTSADNGGTIIVGADGGRWYLQQTGLVEIDQFGASPNLADNTAVLQAALNAGVDLGPGADGIYPVASQLTMSANGRTLALSSNTILQKVGTSISTGYDLLVVTGNNNTLQNVVVDGHGVASNTSAGSGIGIKGAGNLIIGCQSYNNGAHGIYLDGQASTCSMNRIEACQAYSNGQVGFPANSAPDNIRVGNVASNNNFEGFTIDATSFRSLLTGNKAMSNCQTGGVGGIGVDQASEAVITGNIVNNTRSSRPGLQFQNNLATTSFCTVTGNTFTDNTGGGIHLFANGSFFASFNVLSGNNFQNNTNFDIQIDTGCIGNVLTGMSSQAVVKDFNRGGVNPKAGFLCSFRAYANTARSNVTGNGATYQVPFDGITVNNSNSYNVSGVFTAPISGVYHLTAAVRLQGGSTETFGQIKIVQAGSFVQTSQGEVDIQTAPAGGQIGTINLKVDDLFFMQTGDTAIVQVSASGAASNDLTIPSSLVQTYFSGVLVG